MFEDKMAGGKLAAYQAKRDFSITGEPSEGGVAGVDALSFVVQKHWATRLHYDFRIELDGVMVSWAVPKGPSYDPKDKRLAAHVEDHPISYSSFEGTIPAGQYGAGKVIVWDEGTWYPLSDPHAALQAGNLKFVLRGHKLKGSWALIRMKGRGEKQEPWLLIKEKDEYVRPASEFSVVDELPGSVKGPANRAPEKAAAKKPSAAPRAVEMITAVEDIATPLRPTKVDVPRRANANAGASHASAKPAPLPAAFSPQLATLVDAPPGHHSDWVFEIKFDGYRLLARVEGSEIQLFTRNGKDWTPKLKPLRAEIERMKLPDGWYDGEIVALNDKGISDFGALQKAFDGARAKAIAYFVFDAPFMAGFDMRDVPLEDRRAVLQTALAASASEIVRFSEAFDAPAESIVASACHLGLEGVIAKRRDSAYRSARSSDWIKLKCSHRQEFVIGGWTDPMASRTGIGSLLLGVYEDGGLRYTGNVGAGFDSKALASTRAKLEDVAANASPFTNSNEIPGKPHWVEPELVAEVTFAEWTDAGHIRQGVFHALRLDKDPKAIIREQSTSAPRDAKEQSPTRGVSAFAAAPGEAPMSHALNTKFRITHPERVIDASSGITKMELIRYYSVVGELMMAHLRDRPVSLVRAPSGVDGQLFFQKHAEVEKLPGIAQLDAALDPDHPSMLEVATADGLLSVAQWDVVEVHTQNAVARDYTHPNRIVFDLDPGEGVDWPMVQHAAELMRSLLADLGLTSFLKTSGGKGLHVLVPLKPKADWDSAKAFSKAVVGHATKTNPQMFVNRSGGKNRMGKIYIDYLRNSRGSTTVCAWSARSRPGIGISVPVAWEELGHLRGGDHWTIRSAQSRLDVGNGAWKGYAKVANTVEAAAKVLGLAL